MALIGTIVTKCSRAVLFGPVKVHLRCVSRPEWIESCVVAKRYLLSDDVIKLQEFQQKKLSVVQLNSAAASQVKQNLKLKLQSNEQILFEEFKFFLHMCQSVEDMLLAKDVIYRYNAENKNLMIKNFRFGPVIMRQCYELGLEEMAASLLTDKNLKRFFIDTTSYNIAVDMLFKKGSYDRALDVLMIMRKRGILFNTDTLILITGTCCKLNTFETLKICTDAIDEAQIRGHLIPRKALYFAVTLALQKNDVEKAKLLFAKAFTSNNHICQNLRVAILAMSGEVEEAISVLTAATFLQTSPFIKKPIFSRQVVDLLLLWSKGSSHEAKVLELVAQLERGSRITQQTVGDMVCELAHPARRQTPMEEKKRVSRRTMKPLSSTLTTE